jgi:SAM-dependent MidA family methyltransferase
VAFFSKRTEQPLELPLKEPVTFERFMEYCLYHPEEGYYRRGSSRIFGKSGDYMTSPHTHEFFAHCLADYFHTWFLRLDRPSPFQVCELGAGAGHLADQILTYLSTAFPALSDVMNYVEIDLDRGDLPEEITGIVFSNEFFDALPVHRVCFSQGELRELYVVQGNQELLETSGPLSDPRIEGYVEEAFKELREGWIYEVNLRMLEVVD